MSDETFGLLPIGRFARATGLTVKALRHYAEIGLLHPAYVDERTGYRYYALAQLRDAAAIGRLRALGLPLDDVAELLAADEPATRERLAAHRHHLAMQVAGKERIIDELDRLISGDEELVPETADIELTVEQVPARTFVVVRDIESMEKLTSVIPARIGQTADWVFANGGPAGPPMALVGWPDEDDNVDLDVGWRFDHTVEPPAPLELATYEPTQAVICDHLGPFENLHRTYAALERALHTAGLKPTGPARELYETNPEEEPDSEKWLTVIVWPVE